MSILRGRNAFSVNRFKEYLVHEMHKQIRRDFCAPTQKKLRTQIQFGRREKHFHTC